MTLSAGLLVYRQSSNGYEVFLVHPGGPFWARKDAWGMPKGQLEESAEPLATAKREFQEETGQPAPEGRCLDLGEAKSGGKTIRVFAVEGNPDARNVQSNTVKMEWPPRSGTQIEVPEVDKADWKTLAEAASKIHKNQAVFIERLAEKLGQPSAPPPTQSSLF